MHKLRTKLFSGLILLIIFNNVYSETLPEDSIKQGIGLHYGINIGAFWANDYQANFYSGIPGNIDSIGLIFSNPYYCEQIKRELNDTFRLVELPGKMNYEPAIQIGFYTAYNYTESMGIMLQFNYTKLRAKDVFLLGIGAQPTYLTFDELQTYPVWGVEERINIDAGITKTFNSGNNTNLFLEGGLNFNNTKVKEHKILVGSQEFSLINIYGDSPYTPNTQLQTYAIRLGGLGYGGFINGGIKFLVNEKFSLDIGGGFMWSKINLQGYSRNNAHYSIFTRLCFGPTTYNSDKY